MNDQIPKKIAEKVEVLRVWLSEQVGTEVVTLEYDAMHRLHWFRVLLQDARSKDVRTPPMLGISRERLEGGRPIDQIWADLERLRVPERVKKDPEQPLCYSRVGAVEECEHREIVVDGVGYTFITVNRPNLALGVGNVPIPEPHSVSYHSSGGSVGQGKLPPGVPLGAATDDQLRTIIRRGSSD